MLVNADFSHRATLEPAQHHWVASPQPGVERVMLDRVGAKKARATSLVRYAAGSSFPFHQHPGGEEIRMLSGVFSEGHDHYPAGWYPVFRAGDAGATVYLKTGHLPPAAAPRS